MGNVEICGGPSDQEDPDIIYLEGHIRNSQTRAVTAILESAGLKYRYTSINEKDNMHTAAAPSRAEDPKMNLDKKSDRSKSEDKKSENGATQGE